MGRGYKGSCDLGYTYRMRLYVSQLLKLSLRLGNGRTTTTYSSHCLLWLLPLSSCHERIIEKELTDAHSMRIRTPFAGKYRNPRYTLASRATADKFTAAFGTLVVFAGYIGLAPLTIPTLYRHDDKILHFFTFFLLTVCELLKLINTNTGQSANTSAKSSHSTGSLTRIEDA